MVSSDPGGRLFFKNFFFGFEDGCNLEHIQYESARAFSAFCNFCQMGSQRLTEGRS